MGTSSGLLGVGVSALLTTQKVLNTIGHNIANANTEGYSRQRVEVLNREPQLLGGHFVGRGIETGDVKRVYDDFLTEQVRISQSNVGQITVFSELAYQVDDLVADPKAGLTPMLQNFFSAMHDTVYDPASVTSRQSLLSEARSLVDRFNTLESRLADMEKGVNQLLNESIIEINSLAQALADVNNDISLAKGRAVHATPNDLLDTRDRLLSQLSEQIKVSQIEQDDGTINVAIGTGQMLVSSTNVSKLSLVSSAFDPTRQEVGFDTGGGAVLISDLLRGGGDQWPD